MGFRVQFRLSHSRKAGKDSVGRSTHYDSQLDSLSQKIHKEHGQEMKGL